MRKIEYKRIGGGGRQRSGEDVELLWLSALGSDGWEVVNHDCKVSSLHIETEKEDRKHLEEIDFVPCWCSDLLTPKFDLSKTFRVVTLFGLFKRVVE